VFHTFALTAKTDMVGYRGYRAIAMSLVRFGMSDGTQTAEGKMYEFMTQSSADTVEVGRKLVHLLEPPQLLLLRGELGTGKTTLVKGIAEALDAAEADEVTSPTFTLLHEYDGTRNEKPVRLYHLDVYRLEGERQLEALGLDELLTPDALIFVEWGDKFKSIRKRATGEIVIASAGGDARKITVTLKDESASAQTRSLLPEGK
jgi:tRNA threonylcarbamoyladenosine biosynthesis protein TsaE